MITVKVTGHGSFVIAPEKLNELVKWLTANSLPIESVQPKHKGTLLNE